MALGYAAAGFGVTSIFNRIGVRQVSVYVVIGAGIWLAFLKSGVHPTVAALLLGFLTPSRAWVGTRGFPNVLTKVLERLVKSSDESTQKLGRFFRQLIDDLLKSTQRRDLSAFAVESAGQRTLLNSYTTAILAILERIRLTQHGGSVVISRPPFK